MLTHRQRDRDREIVSETETKRTTEKHADIQTERQR